MISTATLAQAGKQQGAALLRFLAILILALLVFAIVLLVFGKNPIEAYVDIFTSTIGSSYGWSEVLVKVIPLVLCATAVLLPARIGLVNVGGEGQLYIGALVASWGALAVADVMPGFLGLPTIIILGFIGGGLWAAIPAVLRAMGWLNETISTLLLNYVAFNFLLYLLYGPWKDPKSAFPHSEQYEAFERLPLVGWENITWALPIALILAVAIWWLLNVSRFGFYARFVDANPKMAAAVGVPIVMLTLSSALLSGAISGVGGFVVSAGIEGRMTQSFFLGYTFSGILIAFLARSNALIAILVAVFVGVLFVAGQSLQVFYQIPGSMVQLIQAIIVISVAASEFFVRHRVHWVRGAG